MHTSINIYIQRYIDFILIYFMCLFKNQISKDKKNMKKNLIKNIPEYYLEERNKEKKKLFSCISIRK